MVHVIQYILCDELCDELCEKICDEICDEIICDEICDEIICDEICDELCDELCDEICDENICDASCDVYNRLTQEVKQFVCAPLKSTIRVERVNLGIHEFPYMERHTGSVEVALICS